ncbi:AAA family ATPase [Paenibacillus sp. LMG 31456]|uniref:AAA family ATPase n=1 Tax=Paenibacillus foliorum TaxID=2654974 RepID=A0A972GT08_9BACL|nr:ATP-binding protein [Paenibacillus foliorum]NOU93914.1 AAA family ATPase [Paenibacillus foliorum]
MRKLIFFVGPAGAGKTTIAKALARKRRMAFLDMDTLLRPSAEVIMRISGNDPNDRDSFVYKTHCRDLGYRVTIDAALENVELGLDVIVVGPFTKEIENPLWLEQELKRINASSHDVDVMAIFVSLPDKELYRQRIQARGLEMDEWKLENWSEFSHSLVQRQIKWPLPASSVYYFDNSGQLTEEKFSLIEQFVFGDGHNG